MSLGGRLSYIRAEFSGIGYANLQSVDKACPNTEFHFLQEKPAVTIYQKVAFRALVRKLAGAVVIPNYVEFFDTYSSLREITFR